MFFTLTMRSDYERVKKETSSLYRPTNFSEQEYERKEILALLFRNKLDELNPAAGGVFDILENHPDRGNRAVLHACDYSELKRFDHGFEFFQVFLLHFLVFIAAQAESSVSTVQQFPQPYLRRTKDTRIRRRDHQAQNKRHSNLWVKSVIYRSYQTRYFNLPRSLTLFFEFLSSGPSSHAR